MAKFSCEIEKSNWEMAITQFYTQSQCVKIPVYLGYSTAKAPQWIEQGFSVLPTAPHPERSSSGPGGASTLWEAPSWPLNLGSPSSSPSNLASWAVK